MKFLILLIFALLPSLSQAQQPQLETCQQTLKAYPYCVNKSTREAFCKKIHGNPEILAWQQDVWIGGMKRMPVLQ